MLNKTILIYLGIFVTALQLFAQSDSTRTWHLYWDYTQTAIDSGKVNTFVITRLNSETSDQVKRTRQIGDLEVVAVRNDTITYRDPDNDIIPNVIYAYTVQAASSDTAFSDPGNVAQAAIPKILAPAIREFMINNDTGLSTGSVAFQVLNPLEEDIDISYTKSVIAPSGGDIDINLGSDQFSFSSSLDSGEVAYVDLTALNMDTTKSFFYTRRVTLLFTSKSNVLESDPQVQVAPKSAQITWRTTEVTRDYVRYGTTPSKGDSTTQDQNLMINHSRTLSYLMPNTTYYYDIVSQTQYNGTYISKEFTFKTDTVSETSVIVGDPEIIITTNSVQINWVTNVATTDYIKYGTTKAKDDSTDEELTPITNHSQTIMNLAHNTSYFFSIVSRIPGLDPIESDEYIFQTDEITSVLDGNPTVGPVTSNSAIITWGTTENTTDYIAYGTTTDKNERTVEESTSSTDHGETLASLTPNTIYYYSIFSRTEAPNSELFESDEYTFQTDELTSVLDGDPTVSPVTSNSATITWGTTENTTDYIAYGTTTDKNERTVEESTSSTDHSETLTNLTPNMMYYYSIFSRTEAPNSELFESDEYTFQTMEQPERGTRAYPVKFRAKQHTHITFYDIPASGTISIYNWNGTPVFEKTGLSPGEFEWFVTNPSGKNLSSGFYLYKIKDQNGNIDGEGTLIIIR